MRGKAIDFALIGLNFRITPAYAGKRIRFFGSNSRRQDHPRLCGEKPLFLFWHYEKLGSPPPMRGKEITQDVVQRPHGITPAYAGKSSKACKPVNSVKDHPRLCGEKKLTRLCTKLRIGSPPPMRGKERLDRHHKKYIRITPAYAGKSYAPVKFHVAIASFRDHPRLCGEKQEFRAHVALPVGSPPPMRGKVWFRGFAPPNSGITPAYAGKRLQLPCR